HTTNSPAARASPSVQAAWNLASAATRTTSTRTGAAAATPARNSGVPSREPTSTKINSYGRRLWRNRLGTPNRVYSSWPQHGTTTDTRAVTAGGTRARARSRATSSWGGRLGTGPALRSTVMPDSSDSRAPYRLLYPSPGPTPAALDGTISVG